MKIEITAMNKIMTPRANKAGDIIVANFDAIIGPLRLHHCALVKIYNKNGEAYKGFAAWLPIVDVKQARRGVTIQDRAFGKELMNAARDVYRALGGDDE